MDLVPYDLEEKTVNELKSKYMDVTIPPDDKNAYAMVMAGLRECRQIRLDVDAWHKENKAWILKAGRHYDAEKKRVHGLIEPIENRLKSVRQAEDNRIEAIKQEKIRQEEERIAGIQKRIEEIEALAMLNAGMSSQEIQARIDGLAKIKIEEETFMEFHERALKAWDNAMKFLHESMATMKKWEEEQTAAKAEAERLEAERKKQEEEQARIDEEKRKIEAEKKALEAAKRAEEERKAREEFERKAQEEARLKAEREAKEKAEREAREKEERERREVEEKARQEALKPDKEKFNTWVQSYMEIVIPEFKDQSISALAKWFEDELTSLVNKAIVNTEAL